MRVLLVQPGIFVYGGAELVITKLMNYLTKRSIENTLLTTSMLPEMTKDLDETKIIIQEKSKIPLNILGSKEMLTLQRGVHRNLKDFDVINVHNYPAELSVFPCRKPVVWMCNEPFLHLFLEFNLSPLSRLIVRTLSAFDKFVVRHYVKYAVVADEFNAKRFERIYGCRPEVAHYGIDWEFFSKGDEKKVLEEFDLFDNFIVLQVGMLTQFKNQMESIITIEKLRNRIPKIKLILAGLEEASYKQMLERYIKERNLEHNVIFTGHLSRDRISDFYQACDVLLHPVRSQGGWLAPFEALCSKKPIVVSTQTTASDIIKKEKIGIVTDNFAEAIWDIYIRPDEYYEIAERGRSWVMKNLSWERFCEKMVNIFYRAMEKAE